MNSIPASSAMRASFRLSGHVPDQRSGTLVTARPDEQLAPNSPIFRALPPCSDIRLRPVRFAFATIIPQAWPHRFIYRIAARQGTRPAEFGKWITVEMNKWGTVVRGAKLTVK